MILGAPDPFPPLPARPNGFRFGRIFLVPGAYPIAIPEWASVNPITGKVLVFFWGVGGGESASNASSGSGAGFTQAVFEVDRGAAGELTVGAGGVTAGAGFTAGGNTRLELGGVILQAGGGGQGGVPGSGSGGDINYSGGPRTAGSFPNGGGAGSPWGPGGAASKWQRPAFWDLTDLPATPFIDVVGIGNGGLGGNGAGYAAAGRGGGGGRHSADVGGAVSNDSGGDGIAGFYF